MMLLSRKLVLVAFISMLFPLSVFAENSYGLINDKYKIYLGGFWPSLDSQINIVGDVAPPGPPISIEDTLGVDDSDGVAWGRRTLAHLATQLAGVRGLCVEA